MTDIERVADIRRRLQVPGQLPTMDELVWVWRGGHAVNWTPEERQRANDVAAAHSGLLSGVRALFRRRKAQRDALRTKDGK